MQTIILEVQESISEKFLWLLSHFKNNEVSIVNQNRLEFLERLHTSEGANKEGKFKPFDFASFIKKVG